MAILNTATLCTEEETHINVFGTGIMAAPPLYIHHASTTSPLQ
jgi:hypothetical protein